MKLKDIFEADESRFDIENALPPTYVIPKLQSSDAYMQYRHSVAMASALSRQSIGKKQSIWGENQAVVCYVDAEKEILDIANKIMGVESIPLSNTSSTESKSVFTKSPVRKFMDITESKDMHSESSYGTIVKVDLNKEVAKDLYNWCDTNGISCIQPDKMHCTLLYSKIPVKKLMQLNGLNIKPSAKILNWKMLGRALVLELDCPVFHVVHSFCKKHGGIHEYDEYIPHLTVNYSWDKPPPKQIPKINLQFSNIKIEQIDPNFG